MDDTARNKIREELGEETGKKGNCRRKLQENVDDKVGYPLEKRKERKARSADRHRVVLTILPWRAMPFSGQRGAIPGK